MSSPRTADEIRRDVEDRFTLTLAAERGSGTASIKSKNRLLRGELKVYVRLDRWMCVACCDAASAYSEVARIAAEWGLRGRSAVAIAFGTRAPHQTVVPWPGPVEGVMYLTGAEIEAVRPPRAPKASHAAAARPAPAGRAWPATCPAVERYLAVHEVTYAEQHFLRSVVLPHADEATVTSVLAFARHRVRPDAHVIDFAAERARRGL